MSTEMTEIYLNPRSGFSTVIILLIEYRRSCRGLCAQTTVLLEHGTGGGWGSQLLVAQD